MSKKSVEGTSSAYRRLKSHQSVGEILETAMSFEKTAMEFYTELADRVNKPLRALVQELAEEELGHYRMFEALKEEPDVVKQMGDKLRVPSSDHRFSDYVHIPDLGEKPDDQAVLQYALGREHAAMEQYGALASEAPDGSLREAFKYLAQQELEHKQELEKRYYEVVHSGGV